MIICFFLAQNSWSWHWRTSVYLYLGLMGAKSGPRDRSLSCNPGGREFGFASIRLSGQGYCCNPSVSLPVYVISCNSVFCSNYPHCPLVVYALLVQV